MLVGLPATREPGRDLEALVVLGPLVQARGRTVVGVGRVPLGGVATELALDAGHRDPVLRTEIGGRRSGAHQLEELKRPSVQMRQQDATVQGTRIEGIQRPELELEWITHREIVVRCRMREVGGDQADDPGSGGHQSPCKTTRMSHCVPCYQPRAGRTKPAANRESAREPRGTTWRRGGSPS